VTFFAILSRDAYFNSINCVKTTKKDLENLQYKIFGIKT